MTDEIKIPRFQTLSNMGIGDIVYEMTDNSYACLSLRLKSGFEGYDSNVVSKAIKAYVKRNETLKEELNTRERKINDRLLPVPTLRFGK